MELSTVDSHEDYRRYLLELLQHKVLFLEEVAIGEGKLIYMILMDFLWATGFKLKLSARKSLPLDFAEVFYISEDQSKLEEDDIKLALELIDEARNLYKKLNIPNSSRDRDFVHKRRTRNPLSESENNDETPIGRTIEKEDDRCNRTATVRREKNISMPCLPKNFSIKPTRGLVKSLLNRFPKICHIKVTRWDDSIQSQEIDIRIMWEIFLEVVLILECSLNVKKNWRELC